jgi:hypothetical protein
VRRSSRVIAGGQPLPSGPPIALGNLRPTLARGGALSRRPRAARSPPRPWCTHAVAPPLRYLLYCPSAFAVLLVTERLPVQHAALQTADRDSATDAAPAGAWGGCGASLRQPRRFLAFGVGLDFGAAFPLACPFALAFELTFRLGLSTVLG